MRIESKLCHISDNKAVVQVTGWDSDQNLGTALAEGSTVDIAEDNAISRLNRRLNTVINNKDNLKSIDENKIKAPLKIELPKSEKINKEPSDWSSELAAIDTEIERLKWSRNEEINFLKKNLGYNNRNKITSYNDIVNYLNQLKKIEITNKPGQFKRNINDLIEESDSVLRDLSWDNQQGREFLQKEFNVSTRKELNEEQLSSFVEKLKSIRNQYFNQ